MFGVSTCLSRCSWAMLAHTINSRAVSGVDRAVARGLAVCGERLNLISQGDCTSDD